MILIRRLLTIPLGLIFFALMVVAILLLAVNDRFLQPDAYPELLANAGVYEFVMGPLLTSALNEARELPADEFSDDLSDNPLLLSGLTTEDISASLNRAFPPDWIQNLVETSFDQVGGYIRGERDEFTIQVQAGEQVRIIVSEIQFLLGKAEAYTLLYDEGLDPFIAKSAEGKLPLDVDVPAQRLSSAVRTILPPDWIQENFERSLDEVTAYLVGDQEGFRIHIAFDDRVPIAAEELKDILADTDAYEIVYGEVIEPTVTGFLGDSVDLLAGVSITLDEVIAAMREVAPVSLVQEQAEAIIDAAVPYLTGESDAFTVMISLTDVKSDTKIFLTGVVEDKLTGLLDLPTCTAQQLLDLLTVGSLADVPECIPPGITTDALAAELAEGVGNELQRLVIDTIPDQVEFTEAMLRSQLAQAGGTDGLDRLDQIRDILTDGFVYTDADLKDDLVGNDILSLQGLEDIRSFLADGWSYTSDELEQLLEDSNGAGAVDTLDTVRENFDRANTFRWLVFLPMAALLVIIGMLGGRRWRSRFAWAGVFLSIGAAIALIASGPVYDAVGQPLFDDLKVEIREETTGDGLYFVETRRLATDKLLEISQVLADDFRSSLFTGSRNLLIVGLAILGLSLGWGIIWKPLSVLRGRSNGSSSGPKPQAKSAGAGEYDDIFKEAKVEYDQDVGPGEPGDKRT